MARISKQDFIDSLSLHVDIETKAEATRILSYILEELTDAMVRGDTVHLSGFGKFEPFTRTNGKVSPKFRPASALLREVAGQ